MRRRQMELETRVAQLEGRQPGMEHVRVEPPPLPASLLPPAIPQIEIPLPNARGSEAPILSPDRQGAVDNRSPAQAESPPPIPPAERPAFETKVGLNWLNRIAVVTLIFGVAFLFKHGVDNNWIGPRERVILGVVCAALSLFGGDRMWRRRNQVFSQGLVGLGLSILYLSFWAAASLYELISHTFAFALMSGVTILGGRLAIMYSSQAIAVMGMLGGFLTPPALATGEDRPWALFTYVLLLNLGGQILGRLRNWRALEPFALAGTIFLYVAWFVAASRNGSAAGTVFALLFYAQFAASNTPLVWGAVQLLAPMVIFTIWETNATFLAYSVLFAVGGLVVSEIRRWSWAPSLTLVCFWLPFSIWSSEFHQTIDRTGVFGCLSVAFLIFFVWVPWWTLWNTRAPRTADLTVAVVNAIAYYSAAYWLLNPVAHQWMGLLAVGIGGLHLALAKTLWRSPESGVPVAETYPALAAAGIALAFVTLAIPIQFSGFRITIAWAAEGAGLAWVSSRFRNPFIGAASGAILFFALARLAAFDANIYTSGDQYSALTNTRFLTFLVAALSLWLTAKFVRTFEVHAGLAYVAGHAVLLWALLLELAGWADRSVQPEDVRNLLTISVSILMAAYGALLIVLGVSTRTVINRIMGLALLGFVILKLYLYDIWLLGRFFRIAALLVLGLMLLAVSYVYSRFRPSIERMLRREPAKAPE